MHNSNDKLWVKKVTKEFLHSTNNTMNHTCYYNSKWQNVQLVENSK